MASAIDSLTMTLPHRGRVFEAHRRIVVHDPPAAFAEHQLIAFSQILEELRTEDSLADGATAVGGFGNHRIIPLLADLLVSNKGRLGHRGNRLRALLAEHVQ